MMEDNRKLLDKSFTVYERGFQDVAGETGFAFERRAGPNIGRSLRLVDNLERGVFLELNTRSTEANPGNPEVLLSYCVRLRSSGFGFPLYILAKKFYSDGITKLTTEEAYALLRKAAQEAASLSEEDVKRDGQRFDDFPADGDAHLKFQ